MSDPVNLTNLFAGLQSNLGSALALHHDDPNAQGGSSEISWIKMLKKYLPKRYEVGRGFVIDSTGQISDSLDLIIFDNYYSPLVFYENDVLYVPVESVFAIFEIKQDLDRDNILYAANKAKSARRLKRTSLPTLQIDGSMKAKPDHGIILAGILTSNSKWKPCFGIAFNKAMEKAKTVSKLDIGCSLRDGSFSAAYDPQNQINLSIGPSEVSLVNFFVELVSRLQELGNPPAVDLRKYYTQGS